MNTKAFFKFTAAVLKNYRQTGAVVPSSQYLANAMSEQVTIGMSNGGRLIELGPGTGKITEKIHDRKPILVEFDADLASYLRTKFPQLEVVHSCAIGFLTSISEPCFIVSSIPLINNPKKPDLIRILTEMRSVGLISGLVTYSYARRSPLTDIGFTSALASRIIWRNVPPATVWRYA